MVDFLIVLTNTETNNIEKIVAEFNSESEAQTYIDRVRDAYEVAPLKLFISRKKG